MFYTLNFRFTNNNVFITLSNQNAKLVYIFTAKKLGFTGSRKTGTVALTNLVNDVIAVLEKNRIQDVKVNICGYSTSLRLVLQLFTKRGLKIVNLLNITPIPHNGCKAAAKARK